MYIQPVGAYASRTGSAGWGLSLRDESELGIPRWTYRADVGYDRINGVGNVRSYVHQSLVFNLVHYSSIEFNRAFYEFAGLGVHTVQTTLNATTSTFNRRLALNDLALGGQAGIGLNFVIGKIQSFAEVAIIGVGVTETGNSTWVPIKLGLRF